MRFSNARWDNDERELSFDVRSSCGVLHFFGGQPGRQFINLTPLDFGQALESNAKPYTEEGRRIQVVFGGNGEIASVDVDVASKRENRTRKRDADTRRQQTKECLAKANEGASFRLCGPDENKKWVAT